MDFALERDGQKIGAGRLVREAEIGRVALLKECRGHGFGAPIIRERINQAKATGM